MTVSKGFLVFFAHVKVEVRQSRTGLLASQRRHTTDRQRCDLFKEIEANMTVID